MQSHVIIKYWSEMGSILLSKVDKWLMKNKECIKTWNLQKQPPEVFYKKDVL